MRGLLVSVQWDSTPQTGTFDIGPFGGFTYVPQLNSSGTEHATYHFINTLASDTEYSNEASVTIAVVPPPNQPPTSSGTCGPFSIPENAGPKELSCLTWTDAEGEFLTGHVIVETSNNPMLFGAGPLYGLADSGTGQWSGRLTFTGATGQTGSASLLLWATDSGGTDNGGNDTSVKKTVKVTIVAPGPTSTAPASSSGPRGTARPSSRPSGSPDILGATTPAPIDSGLAGASPTQPGDPANPSSAVSSEIPGPASSPHADSGSAPWALILIVGLIVLVGSNLVVAASAGILHNDSDVDGPALSVGQLVTAPLHGTIVMDPDGSFTYSPNSGFSGSDPFLYTATDGTLSSNEAEITIRVLTPGATAPPTAAPTHRPTTAPGATATAQAGSTQSPLEGPTASPTGEPTPQPSAAASEPASPSGSVVLGPAGTSDPGATPWLLIVVGLFAVVLASNAPLAIRLRRRRPPREGGG